MKRKSVKWAVLVLLLLAVNLPFEREIYPDGTRLTGALAWKTVYWAEDGSTRIYWFPDSLQGIDNLVKLP